MIGLEVNDAVIVEQRKVLEQALSTNPKTQKALQNLIRRVVMEARAKVVGAAENAMKDDPRHAARAVRTAVYKKILGANINIYNSRKAHGTSNYTPHHHGLLHQDNEAETVVNVISETWVNTHQKTEVSSSGGSTMV